MPSYSINVSGISPESTQQKLDSFFSFCGRISNITLTPSADGLTQTASISFDKESAAKTALLLNEGTLDGAHLHVTSESLSSASSLNGDEHISQEDKPKAGIIAEYLAHGYVFSDKVVQQAIDADKEHGISSRFLRFIQNIDSKVGEKVVGPEKTVSGKVTETVSPVIDQAVNKTKEVDSNRGISKNAGDYYSKALATPAGQKILQFYTTTSKTVLDVHAEARRIADEKRPAHGQTLGSAPADLPSASSSATAVPAATPAGGVAPASAPVIGAVPVTGI